jgi:LacI family transcriptional regulator
MKPSPTLEDVARRCGVSAATVSRALNSPTRVRPETLARIEAAVAELGYTPHFGGRALALGRANTVGVVIPTMENAIFAEGLQAMQERLAEDGVTLLVATSGYDAAREAGQIRALLARGVDGLALIGEDRPEATYRLLQERRVPHVLVWTWRPDAPRPLVGFDNRAAARAIAERTLALGHRRVAMIAGVAEGNDRARLRVEGVRAALAEAGLALEPPRLVEAAYDAEAGAAAAGRLLALTPRPTALLCGNDVLAAGALLGIRRAGLAAPRDVSVTGFDDIDLARLVTPPLTTVRAPHRRMGRAAAELLLRLKDGEAAGAAGRRFDTHVVERESLGPPPRWRPALHTTRRPP